MPPGIPRDPNSHRPPRNRIGIPRDPDAGPFPNAGRIGIPRPVERPTTGPSKEELKFTINLSMRMGLGEKFSASDARMIEDDVRGQSGLDLGSGRKLYVIENGCAYVKQNSKWYGVDVSQMNWPSARY